MRSMTNVLLAALLMVPSYAFAESNLNVNINLGTPVPPVSHGTPGVVFHAPPLFLAPPALGFYVGVDMSHDLVLVSGVYYLFQGNRWYQARHYNGPWAVTSYEQLPAPVRRYKVDKIRYYRDHEYKSYHDNRDHYRGKRFRPGQEGKKEWRDKKEHRKEEKRAERDDRKERKQHDRNHRRDDN